MKIKLMPMLAGAVALSVVATPLIVQAQANTSTQPLLAQANRQDRQGKWDKLNLSEQQKEQLRQIQQETRAQMQALLTPEQQEQFNTAMQNRQGRSGKTALNLSEEQKAQMRQIMEAKKSRMQAILTPAQQQQLEQMRQQSGQRRQQQQGQR
ncbi:MAG: Spy/CpxP family protein refolding chaperone [Coleofasciculus sp. Co-bin14]|nr:Spy/CpxP family protein refolding chaperone [Coleofasciculus sp. Co-bin14]